MEEISPWRYARDDQPGVMRRVITELVPHNPHGEPFVPGIVPHILGYKGHQPGYMPQKPNRNEADLSFCGIYPG